MTSAELEHIFKALDVHAKDGEYALADGKSLTFHVAYEGAALAVSRVEHVRIEGALVVARSPKSSVVFHVANVFAVARDGAGPDGRRPACFGV